MTDQNDAFDRCAQDRHAHRPVVMRDGKWLLEGFIASLALDWENLRKSDPTLPVSLPAHVFDVGFWAKMFRLNPRDFAGYETAAVPTWNSAERKLCVGTCLIKRFRQPARNQETVLSAFSEQAWSKTIDDPLPPKGRLDPKKRLRDTVEALNDNHATPGLLKFHVLGNGEMVSWEMDDDKLRSVTAPAKVAPQTG